MSDAGDAPELALPAPDPDAQTTVNDFLDYTEFFPSDLARSLTLIGDLDSTYRDHVQQVHELTVLYGKLPALADQERPDPAVLRRKIAQHLQAAINQREYAFTEAARLYEVTQRHCKRSTIIKKKLQNQPEPPSRDPTPPPVSPTAHRPAYRSYIRPPHLRLNFDTGRHGANTSRPRDRHRKSNATPRGRRQVPSDSDDSDEGSAIDGTSPRKHKQRADRPQKSNRSRPPGVLGTNVHSSVAGISTSNALAQLAPPPPDAQPGSKWAPWMKLTEYEMAVLRKQMKKNAVWTPSQTMVTRELERKHRTQADFEREKQRCANAGEAFLDEEPETLQQLMNASGLGQLAPHGPPQPRPQPESAAEGEDIEDAGPVSIRLKPIETKDERRLDRLSQRQKAMRDAQELVDATEKIKEAANNLKELTFGSHTATTPASQKKRSATRSSIKRKRDTSPIATEEADRTRDASEGTEESAIQEPETKRARLQLNLPDADVDTVTSPLATVTPISPTPYPSTPQWDGQTTKPNQVQDADQIDEQVENANDDADSATGDENKVQDGVRDADQREDKHDDAQFLPASPTLDVAEPAAEPEDQIHETTTQVPLAPAGPATPKVDKTLPQQSSLPATPQITTPTPESSPDVLAPTYASPVPQPKTTAASSRPRRESVVPKVSSPVDPPAHSLKNSKSSTPVPETKPDPVVLRPRSSRSHVPTPKAQSEEPKPNEGGRALRETRRHSVFSQPAFAEPPQPPAPRASSRRKPPPKGEVSATEDGQKSVTRVSRAQGSKNKKKKKVEEEKEQADDVDEDETRYCICDDISYGDMIRCDNDCEQEWFHLACMKITELPPRRAKWYCPNCRKARGVDAHGNPLVPPSLPGRRGNR